MDILIVKMVKPCETLCKNLHFLFTLTILIVNITDSRTNATSTLTNPVINDNLKNHTNNNDRNNTNSVRSIFNQTIDETSKQNNNVNNTRNHTNVHSSSSRIRKRTKSDFISCCGEKLFLTPYILQGKFEEAKKAARVRNLPGTKGLFDRLKNDKNNSSNNNDHDDYNSSYSSTGNETNHIGDDSGDNDDKIESYSGFLTTNDKLGSHLFFWFFPALINREDAPLMLWLNGGPGSTSMVALFTEHGPFEIQSNRKLKFRNSTWINTHNIIYLDNPVGAGFSHTENDAGYPLSINDIVKDLYLALVQFLTIFSEYQKNDFYVSGQSYAGKYCPALAYKIHQMNEMKEKDADSTSMRIKLQGFSVGSGWMDPLSQINYADYYYNLGLIDENQREYFEQQQDLTRHLIETKNFTQAFIVLESLIVGYPTPYGTSYFEQASGLHYSLNILYNSEPESNFKFLYYLHQENVRKALHVGDQVFHKLNSKVYNLLNGDIYQSIKPKFVDLLNADENYKILIYASQFDSIVPHTTVSSFLNSLFGWKYFKQYKDAKREQWKVGENNDEIAGYLKRSGNLIYALIRNTGHLLPADQPYLALDMITRFTRNKF